MTIPAWEGNWEKRIHDRVFARDFRDLTAFAEARPTATLMQLADELGPQDDIAAVQLELLLRDEALAAARIHRFARSALVRKVHENFPRGWNRADTPSPGPSSPDEWCRASVWAEWVTWLGEEHKAAAKRVWHSLERHVSTGWLPSGPDDSIIVQAFREGGFPEDGEIRSGGDASG